MSVPIFKGLRQTCGILCLLFLFPLISGCAGLSPANRENPASDSDSQAESVFSPLSFYQKYISPVDGDRCPMYPSCSSYCREAVRKHGFLMGWIMTCDRLLRCGRDELKEAPRIIMDNDVYSNDPVSNNDFWW